jgi:uncharacterized membrane protein YdjX (TVP38/TMEM64 family)
MRPRLADVSRLVVSALVLGVLAFIAWKLGLLRATGAGKVSRLTGFGGGTALLAVTFIVVYALIAALALPLFPLAYGAGAVFGFLRAALLVWIGSMLGATAGYLLARYVWGSAARRLLGPHDERLKDLQQGNSALITFRMRLSPIVPFGGFSYAAGISKMPLTSFLSGTALGVIAGTLLATFVGDRFMAGMHGNYSHPLLLVAGVPIVLLVLSFLPDLIERLRRLPRH